MNIQANIRSIFIRNEGRYNHIDGMRALAIIWSFAFHVILLFAEFLPPNETKELFNAPYLRWFLHGHFGVDIFFLISGFLIGNLLLQEIHHTQTLNVLRFLLRRFMRIAPLYYVIIVIFCALAFFTKNTSQNIHNAWANLIFINNFISDLNQFMPWGWSLAVEEQFYIICPFLILFIYRKKLKPHLIISTLLIIGFFINIFLTYKNGYTFYFMIHPALHPTDTTHFLRYYDLLYDKLHTRYGPLLLGVCVAYLVQHESFFKFINLKRWAYTLLFASILTLGWILGRINYGDWEIPLGNFYMATYRYWFALGACALFMLSFSKTLIGRNIQQFLNLKIWYPIAKISYAAYLIQPIVIFITLQRWYHGQHIQATDIVYVGLISGLMTMALSVLLYTLIEKPFLDLRP